ncbi:hypothetical protein PVAP13_6KG145212 [Panicum virgatum]|uniref:Uncharacterized protein n=1 Tax=Panicum virgatum TaxID=38727 RepID=A0A8T0RDN9_PANVG|nr:hypothetical protein PVAP13_6KG145212 [Panicum virgatum]
MDNFLNLMKMPQTGNNQPPLSDYERTMNIERWREGTRAAHKLNVAERAAFFEQNNMTELELLQIEYGEDWWKQPLPLPPITWKFELGKDLVAPEQIPKLPTRMRRLHSWYKMQKKRIGSRELLKFLFDRLDPNSMVIKLGKNRGIHVTPFAVKQVLGIPDSGEDLPLQTNNHASKALSKLKIMLDLEESQDLHASHLQKILKDDLELCSNLIDDEMAIRFFFIIASNKLLFPSIDNNIRCKDIYLTRDLPRLSDMNWCKAVVDDLRHAAHAYHIDKTKKGTPSLPGCAILLIILYLDNLQCKHQIEHMNTPRAKYFDQNLKSSNNTCYYTTHHPFSDVPANNEPLAASYFPSILAELGGFVDQINSRTRQSQARAALAKFGAKSKKASSYMNTVHLMLQNAHQEDKAHGNIGQDHHHQPNTSDTAQADDVSMHGSRNGHNMGSEHLEQHMALESGIPIPVAQHNNHDDSFPPKVPMSKALAVRKKFHPHLKCLSDVFIRYGLKEFNGEEIFESFVDDEWLSTKFMSYFVACLSHDESIHMAEGARYRVFLSPEIGEYVNIEEDEEFSQWDSPPALAIL